MTGSIVRRLSVDDARTFYEEMTVPEIHDTGLLIDYENYENRNDFDDVDYDDEPELFPLTNIVEDVDSDELLQVNRVYREEIFENRGYFEDGKEEVVDKSVYVENNIIFDYQEEFLRLLKVGNREDLFSVRRLAANVSKARHYEDNLEIYHFSKETGLSEPQQDTMLRMINNIMERGHCDSVVPATGRSVNASCEKHLKKLYPTKSIIFQLPPIIFGVTNEIGNKLPHVEAQYYPLEAVLGNLLLNVDYENFAFRPEPLIGSDSPDDRLFRYFSSGIYYENLHTKCVEFVKDKFPSIPEDEILVLSLSIFSDSTQINKLRSRSCNGLLMQLNNQCGNAKGPVLLGFIPESLGMTIRELSGALFKQGFTSKVVQKKIIKYFVRANKLNFISTVLEKLIVWQNNGVKVRVGGGSANPEKSVVKTAFIFLSSILGDAPELDMYAGTSFRNKEAPCRICLMKDCVKCIPGERNGPCRVDKLHDEVCRLSGLAQIAEWENIALKKLKLHLHAVNIEWDACREQARMLGLMFQNQPLYRQFYLQVMICNFILLFLILCLL